MALTQIEGDASGDVRDAVAEAIEGKELSLIGSREVNRAVDKLGDLADLTEKDFKKLATELEADAIVAGKLDKVGTAKTLKFRLFVHKKMAKGFTVSFKDAKSEKFRALLHDKMIDKIGVAGGDDDEARPAKKKKAADDDDEALAAKKDRGKKVAKKAADDEDAEARPAKKSKSAKTKASEDEDARPAKSARAKASEEDEADARPAKKAKAAAADDEDARPKKAKADDENAKPAEDDARPAKKAAADDEEAPRKAKKKVAAADDGEEVEGGLVATAAPRRGANRVAARVDFGASVVQHSFKFNSTKFANQPRNLAISPVPGVRLEGELYPLALASPSGALAGLGLGFDYDKTLRLNVVASDPNGGGASVTVPGKQSHYSIGARYRLVFGATETSPSVTLGVGYGKRLFSTPIPQMATDTERNAVRRDTPETSYTIIDPGLMFRLPVTRMVQFTLGGRGLVVTDAGPIVKSTSYGRAKVYGGEATAAVDIVFGSHVALRFSGEFVQIGYKFLGGTNTLANSLDGDPMHQDVGGLADRSIGGSATLAVLY
ncbi:MAG: hypothetical protein E6J90_07115 [Deltaproteobacteria bacterium]|nr:MAG: hypothetical protein E6J90_07115 [Deltaproteobacteria bacterium]